MLLKLADFGSALDEYAWQKLYGTQVHAPLSYQCMSPEATSVFGLKLRVYEA